MKTIATSSALAITVICLVSLLPVAMSRSFNHETMNEIGHRGKFDPSCRGEFNTKLYSRLNNVCNDCYYIFYSEEISDECKSGCFNSEVFEACTSSLKLPVDKYREYALRLQSKKKF